MKFHFKGLLQISGWIENAVVETDDSGAISAIETFDSTNDTVFGFAIPGFQNAHSHSFQYTMAGLAENHASGQSDFWSWREAMYRLAVAVNPDQFEAIATMLYSEMLRHGYTNVAEFHYLHHDKNGKHYDNLAEMGLRLISAAKNVGIGITLIPIFYQNGGFQTEAQPNQQRFISKTIDEYRQLYDASENACKGYDRANIGVGIHSMRAVEPDLIKIVAQEFPKDVPFHIHISEQKKEVEDCVEFLGTRPVRWMLDNIELSDRFHFVHATHLDDYEIEGLANSVVNVVLCPSTEGNLGDGLFPLRKFQDFGGNWSIGTDSHVSLNPFEELRLLDYGQRLTSHRRNTFSDALTGNSAEYALRLSTISGRKAMNNFQTDFFEVGKPFDACVISAKHPLIQTASPENRLNSIVYSSDESMQSGAMTAGKLWTESSDWRQSDGIVSAFLKAIHELKNR